MMNEAVSSNVPEPARRLPGRWEDLGWMASLFLTGFGGKLYVLLTTGCTLPFWDQWSGEAATVYRPFFEKTLSLADLFQPHNEHRIFFTRALNLLLLLWNGQWDNEVEAMAGAVLHSAILAGFGGLMATLLGRRYWPFIWLPLALALVVPFGWENTVGGFQSQFYFLLLFSGLTIWWLGLHEPLSPRWWLGVLAAVASLFTMASGFLAVAAAAMLVLPEVFQDRRRWRRHLPTFVVCGILGLRGLIGAAGVQQHEALKAHSAGEFLSALGGNLAWPWVKQSWLAPFMVAPLLLLGWMCLRSPEKASPGERLILGVGFWTALQMAATAYARGGFGATPSWRYMDLCSWLMITGSLSILVLWTRYRERLVFPRMAGVCFAAWVGAGLWGLWFLTGIYQRGALPMEWHLQDTRLAGTRAFLATDDPRVFQAWSRYENPAPDLEELVALLRHKQIRGILPGSVREPLKVTPMAAANGGFVTNGCAPDLAGPATAKSWGSYSQKGAAARGVFESQPVARGSFPYLQIPVAGDLGDAGLSLELVELKSGKKTPVKLPGPPRGRWLNAYVKAPTGDFKIVARDDNDQKWFAFKAPVEIARLSYWGLRLPSAWKYFVVAGIGWFLVNVAWLYRRNVPAWRRFPVSVGHDGGSPEMVGKSGTPSGCA